MNKKTSNIGELLNQRKTLIKELTNVTANLGAQLAQTFCENGIGAAGTMLVSVKYNPKDPKIVTGKFSDGDERTVTLKGADVFDINVAVALLLCEKAYGSKSAFRRFVQSKDYPGKFAAKNGTKKEDKAARKEKGKAKAAARSLGGQD